MSTLVDQVPEPLRALLRTASWHRRLLASGCAAAAIAFALTALTPKPHGLVKVLAAARDIPAGATLSAADVHTIGVPPAVVPAGALRAGSAAVGRVVAAALRQGEMLTDVRLVGAPLFGTVGAGLVAAPVRIADPSAALLLQPGDVIDVLASTDHSSAAAALVVAAGVRVLTVPSGTEATGGLDDGALVVVAATPATAALLAKAAIASRLSVLIRGEPR
jgi:Flp pilus assembly protein CpaB